MLGLRLRDNHGFSLMEIMFVVLILGILVAIVVASYVAATARAEATACRANVRVLEGAIVSYQAANSGDLPGTLADLNDYVNEPDYCFADHSVDLTYDPDTGYVSCPTHP